MIVVADTISDGNNPLDKENQPTRISAHSVLCDLIVASAAIIFGNSLRLHRVVAALFIARSCIVCCLLHRKSLVTRNCLGLEYSLHKNLYQSLAEPHCHQQNSHVADKKMFHRNVHLETKHPMRVPRVL